MALQVMRDVRYAVRQLVRAPGFALVAILTLALGIGATTAIFSVVNGVLLRPLPYPDSDALVRVNEIVPQYGRFSVAPANFLDWRRQNTSFERVAAYTTASATFTNGNGPERIQGALVSWDVFELLRVAPALGSTFTSGTETPGRDDTIVLSHALWENLFGGDPSVVGRTITISSAPVTIVGVMPADFYFPSRTTQFWRPLAIDPANASRGGHFLGVVARLKAGVEVDRARVEMRHIAEALALKYPEASAKESAEVVPLQEQIIGTIRPALLTLFAAVGVLVLIACANIANLLLVRASVREKEIAIRTALGAGRRRLASQMLAESLVLAVTGGALGVLLGYLALAPIRTLGAGSIPRVADVTIDNHVLLFAAAAALVTGILFGLAPAWQAAHASVGAVLKESGRSSTTSGGRWLRSALMVAEVALSIILLTGATLLIRSFSRLTNVDPGFATSDVMAFQLSLPQSSYKEDPKVFAFWDTLTTTLAAAPGVRAVGLVQSLPMRGDYVLTFDVRGRAPAAPGSEPSASYRAINAQYFEALRIPVIRGRVFTATDLAHGATIAVIDQAFAKRYFPDSEPIGQGLKVGNGVDAYCDIVGVVGDVHYYGLDATVSPTMYMPETLDRFSTMWVVARAQTSDPMALAATARRVVGGLDSTLPTYSMSPLASVVSDSVASQRFSVILLLLFALTALVLAAVGLYGVVAYAVAQRTREIGLRMAIGASPRQIVALVVFGSLRTTLVGVVIGLAGALALARLVRTLLFEVEPFDPASYAITTAVLLVVAIVACYVPARRAMRVDPMVALQAE